MRPGLGSINQSPLPPAPPPIFFLSLRLTLPQCSVLTSSPSGAAPTLPGTGRCYKRRAELKHILLSSFKNKADILPSSL